MIWRMGWLWTALEASTLQKMQRSLWPRKLRFWKTLKASDLTQYMSNWLEWVIWQWYASKWHRYSSSDDWWCYNHTKQFRVTTFHLDYLEGQMNMVKGLKVQLPPAKKLRWGLRHGKFWTHLELPTNTAHTQLGMRYHLILSSLSFEFIWYPRVVSISVSCFADLAVE